MRSFFVWLGAAAIACDGGNARVDASVDAASVDDASVDAADVCLAAPEVCDGADDDCDGVVDEGLLAPLYLDADADTFGDRDAPATMLCPSTSGYAAVATDCDDRDASTFPGATETCDTTDEDCDGTVDEEVGTTFYRDLDRDGYGVLDMTIVACAAPSGYSSDAGDCDDEAAAARPFGEERCDGIDNDCNDAIDEALGGECTVGIGACAAVGRYRCDGSCTATAGAPITSAQTEAAPNGSWDWDCDGLVLTSVVSPVARHSSGAQTARLVLGPMMHVEIVPHVASAGLACLAAGCDADLVCHPESPSDTPGSCGAPLRCLARGGDACTGGLRYEMAIAGLPVLDSCAIAGSICTASTDGCTPACMSGTGCSTSGGVSFGYATAVIGCR
jgi:hypothetical protein